MLTLLFLRKGESGFALQNKPSYTLSLSYRPNTAFLFGSMVSLIVFGQWSNLAHCFLLFLDSQREGHVCCLSNDWEFWALVVRSWHFPMHLCCSLIPWALWILNSVLAFNLSRNTMKARKPAKCQNVFFLYCCQSRNQNFLLLEISP